MDRVYFRTLGGRAARDAELGARPDECRGYHGFAGSNGFWRRDLGSVVAAAGVNCALVAAAVPLLLSLVLTARLSINFTRTLNFDPAPVTNLSQSFGCAPPPDHGPVAVAVEFKIDSSRRREFLNLMQEIRRLHLRNGPMSGSCTRILTAPIPFVSK